MSAAKQAGLPGLPAEESAAETVAEGAPAKIQFSVGRRSLLAELSYVGGTIEKKTTIPILGNFLLVANIGDDKTHQGLVLRGTDLDVSLTTKLDAEVKQGGQVCLPMRKVLEMVKSLPEGEIEFTIDGTAATIKSGRTRFKVAGAAAENFPAIEKHEGQMLRVPAKKLRDVFAITSYAMTKDESRYTLNGVQLEIGNDRLRAVATDGHRLALADRKVPTGDFSFIRLVPAKAVTEADSLLTVAKEDAEVGIGQSENHLFFDVGHRSFVSRFISGNFPDYQLVLPKGSQQIAAFNSEELRAAVRQVKLMADERTHTIRIELRPRDEGDGRGTLEVLAPASETGEASSQIEVGFNGSAVGVAFNATYILETLESLGDVPAHLKFKGAESPTEFGPAEEEEGDSVRLIVMPMRI
jgi:DNA polymerase-3 subunit beta